MSTLANNTRYYDDTTYVPDEPILISDITTILVEAISAGFDIEISMNTHIEIQEGAANVAWYNWKSVTAGPANSLFQITEYGPNAIRFVTGGATFKAWVKG